MWWMHTCKIGGWNLKITRLKRRSIFQTFIFVFFWLHNFGRFCRVDLHPMFKGGHIFQTIMLGIQPLLFGRILYPNLDPFGVKKPSARGHSLLWTLRYLCWSALGFCLQTGRSRCRWIFVALIAVPIRIRVSWRGPLADPFSYVIPM